MGTGARPTIILRSLYQTSANRVPFHIADCLPEVCRIQGATVVSALPEMSAEVILAVEVNCERAVTVSHAAAERLLVRRRDDEMNVIGHQAVGEDLERIHGGILLQ